MQQTEKVELGNVFSDSKLIIPRYQRDYSWTEKQVDDLFDDILYTINNYYDTEDKYHYFGTLVLEKQGKVKGPASRWDKYAVVDGQQRLITTTILIRVVVDVLEDEKKHAINDETKKKIEQLKNSLLNEYVKDSGNRKFILEGLSEGPYNEIVVAGEDPHRVVDKDSPLVAHRIKEAYNTLKNRLTKEVESETNSLAEKIDYIEDIVFAFTGDFKLTPNILDDMDEASRMFKVINDRGRDLTELDKIKSHLMYCCTVLDDLEPEIVSRRVNSAVETITEIPGSSEKDLQRYVKIHWDIFSGEQKKDWLKNHDGYNEGYKRDLGFEERLQGLPWYASISRERNSLSDFVTNYIESLENLAKYYVYCRFPDYSYRNEYISKEISNMFYAFKNTGNYHPYMIFSIGCLYAFDDGSGKFTDENNTTKVEKCLKYVRASALFYNQVLSNTGAFTVPAENLGHKSFWYKWQQENNIKKEYLFSGRKHSMYNVPSTNNALLDDIESSFTLKIENKLPIDSIKDDYLLSQDVISAEFTDGWGGFKSKKTVKTLLYYYEKELRSSEMGKLGLPTLQKWCENTEIEHMVPQNPQKGGKLPHHDKQINKIGNLLVLTSSDNISASNNLYEEKYEENYKGSNLEMVNELPEELDVDAIDKRSEDIADELLNSLLVQ